MERDHRFAQAVELTTATYDRAAGNYAERNEDMQPHWIARFEQFLDLLAQGEAERPIPELGRPGDDITLEEYLNFVPVLDAGCGHGRDARAFAARGLPALGVDLSEGMLDQARQRTPMRLPKGSVRYALMDLRRLELPDGCCRGVWCSASLLHIPRKTAPRAMRELARVVRPGAPVIVFLKQLGAGEPERMLPYPFPDVTDMPRFYAFYTPEEARTLVEGAGLAVVDVQTADDPRVTDDPGWVSVLARRIA
ncbi:MAG TPA: class I SAM-dependent methyltransferase [Ktedonobacterales bacterium]|nr:class I SAM-dependent methyltransferase [Ktedonobacterales bacterium]